MRQQHVILKFDYEVWGVWTKLSSTVKFPKTIHDVKFIELVNFSPSAVLFMFTCDKVDKGFLFSNFEKNVLAMGLGGASGETRAIARVDPSKSNMDELTLKMFYHWKGTIYKHRRDYARAHVSLHFGEDDLLKKEINARDTLSPEAFARRGRQKSPFRQLQVTEAAAWCEVHQGGELVRQWRV